MFSLFASQEKKMRDNARNWLEVAEKVCEPCQAEIRAEQDLGPKCSECGERGCEREVCRLGERYDRRLP